MRVIFQIILLLIFACLFSSERETNEKSSQTLRVSQNVWPHHYVLKLSVQLKLEDSSFRGGTIIKLFSLEATDTVLVNFSSMKIHTDDITIIEAIENQRFCLSINKSKTYEDDEKQILTIIVDKQLKAFGIYEVYIPFRVYFDSKLKRIYQSSSFDIKPQSTNWLPGNQTDPVNSHYTNTFSSVNQLIKKTPFMFSEEHGKKFKASVTKSSNSSDELTDNLDCKSDSSIHTILISPYFFTLFISEFGNINSTSPSIEIPIDLWTKKDESTKSNFSMEIVVEALNFCMKYLNLPFALRKIDTAVIPAAAKVYPTRTNHKYTKFKKEDVVTILQINVNRSSLPQNLALDTARQINAKLIILSEPYLLNGKLQSTPGWLQISSTRTAILIDETLGYTMVNVNSGNTVAIEIENILIISTYISPNEPVEEEFLILQNLLDREPRVILAGDFNCRHPQYTDQRLRERDRIFQLLIKNHGLLIANNNIPTLKHQGRLSINDYTLYRRVEITNWQVLEELESLSDHRYIAYKINIQRSGRKVVHEVDEARIEELLKTEQLRFDEPENRHVCNEFATSLTNFLSNLTETCTVERAIISKSLYWNDDLEAVDRTLKQLRKKEKQTGISVFKKIIKILESDFQGMIREAKRKAWRNFDMQNTVWGQPPKIKLKNFQRAPQLISDETLLLEKLGPKSPTSVSLEAKEVEEINEEGPEVDYTVSEAEVTKILKFMPNHTKPGLDGINFKTLKMVHKKHPTLLPQLFSACLRFKLFPDAWKKGKVIWFPKTNKDPSSSDGYRPITLLSTLGKVFEKCIVNRMWTHVQENNIISSRQFGFIPQKNKESCVRSLLEDIRSFRQKNNYVAVVKIDIEAAFDTLSWNHIIGQLRKYKFPTYLVDLVTSYLQNRTVISGTASIILERGCPQGSVLGPLLWNLSYNYILEHFLQKRISVFCYADDTSFVLGAENQQNLIEKIRSMILETVELISPAGLKLCLSKTGVMISNGNAHLQEEPELLEFNIEDKKIKTCESFKYLGFTIDNYLN